MNILIIAILLLQSFLVLCQGKTKAFDIMDRILINIPIKNDNRRGIHEPSTTLFRNPFTVPLPAPNCSYANSQLKCGRNIRYRTFDGSCNNLNNHWWGARLTPYQRLLEHDYGKDDAPKISHLTRKLPLSGDFVKTISSNVRFNGLNALFTFFSQFLAHDVANTESATSSCDCSGKENPSDCFNILDSEGDCKPFSRSKDVKDTFGCDFSRREQYTSRTHWLDADILYGSTLKQSDILRTFSDGLLQYSFTPGSTSEAMPVLNINQCIEPVKRTVGCFLSGDPRHEQTSTLLAVNVIFLRMHNNIARGLHAVNPHWNDQKIYSESRRILIAIYQNIIYSEYLPILLGNRLINEFGLYTFDTGYSYSYDDSLYPNNYNEFIAAGFRLHNLVHNRVKLSNSKYETLSTKTLHEFFFNQFKAFNELESVIYGLVTSNVYAKRFQMASSLHKDLFKDFPNTGDKRSLTSRNIQRGRDHGLRRYSEYRYLAGLNLPRTFEDVDNMEESTIETLKSIYENVNDIDLWIGLIAEQDGTDGVVGRTQGFLIARNFYNLKYGDRLYFENGQDKVNRFTKRQLSELRRLKISNILCDTLEGVTDVPRYGFYQIFEDDGQTTETKTFNPKDPCTHFRKINYELWREY